MAIPPALHFRRPRWGFYLHLLFVPGATLGPSRPAVDPDLSPGPSCQQPDFAFRRLLFSLPFQSGPEVTSCRFPAHRFLLWAGLAGRSIQCLCPGPLGPGGHHLLLHLCQPSLPSGGGPDATDLRFRPSSPTG